MAKRKLDTVQITLDKPRTMKFDFNALIELESITGKPVAEIFTNSNWNFAMVRDILYVSLIHEDDTLTVKQVGSMIEVSRLQEIMEALGTLLTTTYKDNSKNA